LIGKPGHHLWITHSGVNDAEHTLRKPTEPTTHFSSDGGRDGLGASLGNVDIGTFD